ncbi:Wadjet anti-phage system protein JetD domain-containing protein [Glaciibacter flavus]|nr:Wadjet anti-phage system protein JetD domain-containing protein [Glaciibacter flavus]
MRTSRVVYWGDLDSDGFAILHSAQVESTPPHRE